MTEEEVKARAMAALLGVDIEAERSNVTLPAAYSIYIRIEPDRPVYHVCYSWEAAIQRLNVIAHEQASLPNRP